LEDDSERLRREALPRWEELPRWLDPYGLDAPFEAPTGLFESPWRLFELFEALPELLERLEPS
jgi:hypothetical protein